MKEVNPRQFGNERLRLLNELARKRRKARSRRMIESDYVEAIFEDEYGRDKSIVFYRKALLRGLNTMINGVREDLCDLGRGSQADRVLNKYNPRI